jgi:hypothetical protein
MKYIFPVLAGFAALTVMFASPETKIGSEARARELIKSLNLTVLPKESGYLGVIGRSAQTVTIDGRALAVQSQNYYLLTRERPINYLHWLAPDDTHILIEGGPVARRRSLWARTWRQVKHRSSPCPGAAGKHCACIRASVTP